AQSASVDSSQPPYTPSYQQDRELAAQMVGASGCGLVKALRSPKGGPDSGPGSDGGGDGQGGHGVVVVTVGLILLPMIILLAMRLSAGENRRRYERFKVNTDVKISVGDRELIGSVSSLSLGGVQVNTNALLQDGGLITLIISSPNGDERVEVAGRVVW